MKEHFKLRLHPLKIIFDSHEKDNPQILNMIESDV